ncbi:MAG: DUF86 domain-containing protein [Syntrophobacteria bacterium]
MSRESRKRYVRKERILDYLENIQRQLDDLHQMPVDGPEFFLDRSNFERIKAIKYSLACAIQDVTRVSLHIAVALGTVRVRESEAEAIIALGGEGVIPPDLTSKIKGMPSFRNRIIQRLGICTICCIH